MSMNGKTDELLRAIGKWQIPPPPGDKWVYVYDNGYWFRSRALYEQVKNASWDDVILNEEMKKQITSLMHKFFDSREIYKNLGVPWKRGVIFHGTCIFLADCGLQFFTRRETRILNAITLQDRQETGKPSPSRP